MSGFFRPGFFPDVVGAPTRLAGSSTVILDTSTTLTAAQIETAMAACTGEFLFRGDAVYTLDRPVVVPTNVRVIGTTFGRPSLFIPAAAWSGSADDGTNCFFHITGALSGSATLAADVHKDKTSITVSANTGLAIGDWIAIRGHNSTNSYGHSDGADVILEEVVQIANISGTTITLATPLTQFHDGAATTTVKKVVNHLDTTIDSLHFDGTGETVAAAIYARHAVGLHLAGLRGKQFSRAILNLEGVKNFTVKDLYSEGGVNSAVFMQSCQSGLVSGTKTSPTGERYHSSGIPRGLINLRFRCNHVKVVGSQLERGCVAVQLWGGEFCEIIDTSVRDMETGQANTQWQTVSEGGGSARIGAAFHGGATTIGIEEFGFGNKVINFSAEHCRHTDQAYTGCTFYLHDQYGIEVSDVRIYNRGTDSETMAGMVISDASGVIDGVQFNGTDYGIVTENSDADFDVFSFRWDGRDGTPTQHTAAVVLNHANSDSGPRLYGVKVGGGTGTYITFGSSFADPRWYLEDIFVENVGDYSRGIPAYNGTGVTVAAGDVVRFNGSQTVNSKVFAKVAQPNGVNGDVAVVVQGGANTALIVICPLPAETAVILAETGAVALDDLLETQNASFAAVVNNASAVPLGRALTAKSAGSTGLVCIRPIL